MRYFRMDWRMGHGWALPDPGGPGSPAMSILSKIDKILIGMTLPSCEGELIFIKVFCYFFKKKIRKTQK